jgi:hypothetical protein
LVATFFFNKTFDSTLAAEELLTRRFRWTRRRGRLIFKTQLMHA